MLFINRVSLEQANEQKIFTRGEHGVLIISRYELYRDIEQCGKFLPTIYSYVRGHDVSANFTVIT